MGDHLDGAPAKIPPPFFVQHAPIYFSGGYVRIFCQVLINKTFIMPQIQIGFRPVVGDEHLAVLDRVHGAGVDIDVGVEFLHGDFISPGFEQAAQGSCGNAFSQAGDYAAGDKDVFYRHKESSFLYGDENSYKITCILYNQGRKKSRTFLFSLNFLPAFLDFWRHSQYNG